MTGREYLIEYFKKMEDSLIKLSETEQMPKKDTKDTGDNREYLVYDFFKKHLPLLAEVKTGGMIIDSDTPFEENEKGKYMQQADIVIYNRFSFSPNFFPAGFYPVESIYLALEVKSLITQMKEAIEQCSRIKKLKKRLRPETLYFGYHVTHGEYKGYEQRDCVPSAAIWIWPKGKKSYTLIDLNKKIKEINKIENGEDKIITTRLPDCIYIPSNFLAFRVFIKKAGKDIMQQKSEYWYCDGNNSVEFKYIEQDTTTKYVEYTPKKKNSPSRLQIFTYWLSQEILKFVYEVPDFFLYAFTGGKMKERCGYKWDNEICKPVKYNGEDWIEI